MAVIAPARFALKGNIMPIPGPGFTTPTFQRGSSNGLWIQDIGDEDRVTRLLELAPALVEESRALDFEREQSAGAPAIYVFHGREASYADTRPRLTDALRYEYELLEDFPYLRRSIGRFVGDEGLAQKADAQIAEWTRATPKFSPQPWSELRERFLRRGLFDEVGHRAKSGTPIVIHGRRGSGKSLLLAWLADELHNAKRRVFRVPVRPNNSIIPALFELGAVFPEWTLDARDGARAYGQLVRSALPTAEADRDAVARFADACHASKEPVTLFLDDFDVSLGDRYAETGNRALLGLMRSNTNIQIIAAMASTEALQAFGNIVQPFNDLDTIELPDLDRSEVEQLFRRIGDRLGGDLEDLELMSIGHRLAGFNFREALDVLARFATSKDHSERATRKIVAERCERIFLMLLEISSKVGIVLGMVSPDAQRSFATLSAEAERDPEVRRAWLAAMQNGLIKGSPESGIRFQHRYVRDWWTARGTGG